MDTCHELNTPWVLWEHYKRNNVKYENSMLKIGEFCTLERFWQYLNNYPQPGDLFSDGKSKPILENPEREISSISMFREGILPKWEDPKNINGGELAIRKFKSVKEMNNIWEILAILCVGEQFKLSQHITGIRVVDSTIPKKTLYRIEVWFDNKDLQNQFDTEIKKLLKISPSFLLFFKKHSNCNFL